MVTVVRRNALYARRCELACTVFFFFLWASSLLNNFYACLFRNPFHFWEFFFLQSLGVITRASHFHVYLRFKSFVLLLNIAI